MIERIVHFTIEGSPVIGFDTGLSAAAFAQAKLAQFISQTGYIVSPPGPGEPDPSVSLWKPQGVVERKDPAGLETMVIWGPDFPGERLDRLLEDGARKDQALDALRYWLRARRLLAGKDDLPAPFPGGALIAPGGFVLLPPERLIRRAVEAGGPGAWVEGAEGWMHPDLSGGEGVAFAAAAMAYRIFCGVPPFGKKDAEAIHEDIREGVFLPPRLAAPGLRISAVETIARSLAPAADYAGRKAKRADPANLKRPEPADLEALLGPPGSTGFSGFFSPLGEEERQKIAAEREQYQKKRGVTVKTKRFVRRNTVVLMSALAGLVIAGLITYSVIRGRADMPTTRGMGPREVVETYYGAFDTLDHTLMEACVLKKAGQEDINLVTNLFVISRMRQAYEMNATTMTPREWMEGGSLPTALTVFGISDLRTEDLDTDERDGRVSYRVSYELWLPDLYPSQDPEPSSGGPSPESGVFSPVLFIPRGSPVTDEVELVLYKDAWRIGEIRRREEAP
jgi:hypothetical protein